MPMDARALIETRARAERKAARALALCPTRTKNDALTQMARGLGEKTQTLLARAREKVGAPADAVQYVDTTDRAAVAALLELDRLVDLIIPRGGEELVRWVSERSLVPVLKNDKGLVHTYVDADADVAMAVAIVVNAKAQRPSVCNALETLLVHREIAPRLLPAP